MPETKKKTSKYLIVYEFNKPLTLAITVSAESKEHAIQRFNDAMSHDAEDITLHPPITGAWDVKVKKVMKL